MQLFFSWTTLKKSWCCLWKKSAERAMYAKGQCEKMKFRVGLAWFGAKKETKQLVFLSKNVFNPRDFHLDVKWVAFNQHTKCEIFRTTNKLADYPMNEFASRDVMEKNRRFLVRSFYILPRSPVWLAEFSEDIPVIVIGICLVEKVFIKIQNYMNSLAFRAFFSC